MENASDALIMAGQVLIFIIALTVCISSFTTIRVSIDNVIDQTETIKLAKDSDSYINFIKSRDNGSVRIVGAETIVSSMYRAIKENYVLYIKLKNFNSLPLSIIDDPKIKTDNDHPLKIVYAQKDLYIKGNSNKKINKGDKIIKVTIASDSTQKSNTALADGLYKNIKELKFLEYLGEWQNASAANSEDKITNRIITYIEE